MEDILVQYLNEEKENTPEALLKTNPFYLGKEVFIIAKDEFNLIFGQRGNGKSWFVSHVIQQFVFEVSEWMIKYSDPVYTILIDTEQGKLKIINTFVRSSYKGESKEEIKFYKSKFPYQVLSIRKEKDKIKAIEDIIQTAKNEFPNHHLFIVLDNLTHAVEDTMSSNNQAISRLNAARGDNSTFLAVLHANNKEASNTENPTGVIGSQAENNAAIVWKVEKKVGKYLLENKKTRYHDDTENVIFEFSLKSEDEICYFESCELREGKINSTIKKIDRIEQTKCIVTEILNKSGTGDDVRLRKNIIAEIMKVTGNAKTSANNWFNKLIENKSFVIEKNDYVNFTELPF